MMAKARLLAQRWVSHVYRSYLIDKYLWEKYDVTQAEYSRAGGGEYENQIGFGWTNGAILDILRTFDDMEPILSGAIPTFINLHYTMLIIVTIQLVL
ncbi:hypothetical protein AB6A40_011106 [Gnathostoma spinigerum]|uniref:Trehalase n=1 Tax=Gnathostoma spinigerum TaxID=75299 RepID=A0ABD6F3X4_9BILA